MNKLHHIFNGLSLYNDHFRFGGILDYCIANGMIGLSESEIFESDVNREMISNVEQYVACINEIYKIYSKAIDTKEEVQYIHGGGGSKINFMI
uniref:Uncharacterized protein n=1 Tax=Meloidogyne hapla TaxID=6305 RepID=A0A1I8BG42_MELHA